MKTLKAIWKQARSQVKIYLYWLVIFGLSYLANVAIYQKWHLVKVELAVAFTILLVVWIIDSVAMYLLNRLD